MISAVSESGPWLLCAIILWAFSFHSIYRSPEPCYKEVAEMTQRADLELLEFQVPNNVVVHVETVLQTQRSCKN